MSVISKIINRKTGGNILSRHTDKKLSQIECEIGQELRVVFESGASFTHEEVESRFVDGKRKIGDIIIINTTNKIWVIEGTPQENSKLIEIEGRKEL